jgi:phosphorylcholine metabolism protein LicD
MAALINKTDLDQLEHNRLLSDVQTLLWDNHISAVLSGSGLLGYIRDKQFLPWVPGLVLLVYHEDIVDKIDTIFDGLDLLGFKRKRKRYCHKSTDVNFIIGWKDKFAIEIQIYKLIGKYRVRELSNGSAKVIPAHLLNKTKKIVLNNTQYTIPEDTDAYLSHMYKDWKTPIITNKQSCKRAKFFMSKKSYTKLLNRKNNTTL